MNSTRLSVGTPATSFNKNGIKFSWCSSASWGNSFKIVDISICIIAGQADSSQGQWKALAFDGYDNLINGAVNGCCGAATRPSLAPMHKNTMLGLLASAIGNRFNNVARIARYSCINNANVFAAHAFLHQCGVGVVYWKGIASR